MLLGEFGSLSAVLAASRKAQRRVIGDNPTVLGLLQVARQAQLRALRTDLPERLILSNYTAVFDYLMAELAHLQTEHVRILHLDMNHRLLRDELTCKGTVNEARVYTREVMRRALEIGAAGLIIVHNHPSGNSAPSAPDRSLTLALMAAGRSIDIAVHDHIVVSRNGCVSMRAINLL